MTKYLWILKLFYNFKISLSLFISLGKNLCRLLQQNVDDYYILTHKKDY